MKNEIKNREIWNNHLNLTKQYEQTVLNRLNAIKETTSMIEDKLNDPILLERIRRGIIKNLIEFHKKNNVYEP
jgi:hypothetical protein